MAFIAIVLINDCSEDWERMEYYVKQINENDQNGSFLRAVLAIRNEQYQDAMAYIEKVI